MSKHIAIITVAYNNYTVLNEFVERLRNQSDLEFHLYIVDASDEKKTINISGISNTILPITNKGYAHGVNAGLKMAVDDSLQYFCIINDDVEFDHNFVKKLKIAFSNNPNAIFGGKIFYAPGFEYHKNRYPKEELGKVIWYGGGTVDWKHATTHHVDVDEVDDGLPENALKTDFITGCLMCFDNSVLEKVGFWDEKYFLYYEDADFCERAKKHNVKLIYDPNIIIWHKNAQSTGGSGSTLHQKFQRQARLRFAIKFAPLRTKLHVLKNYIFNS